MRGSVQIFDPAMCCPTGLCGPGVDPALLSITRDLRWRDRQSYYTQHGDWFLVVCAILAVAVYYLVLSLHPPRLQPGAEAAF